MQFKKEGETAGALSSIMKAEAGSKAKGMGLQFTKGQDIASHLKDYSNEATIAALAQSDLTEQQIRGVLTQRQYTGELLDHTTSMIMAEQSNEKLVKSMKPGEKAVKSLKDGFTGLGQALKAALPMMIAMAAVIWAVHKKTHLYNK